MNDITKIRKQLSNAIKGTEFEGKVYLAGGIVRDELLRKPVNDIDLCVEFPDGGIRLAHWLHEHKLASKPIIYRQFGTALISLDDYKIELVMTRRESYRHHSRKPEVEFGSLLEDVLRRDFTVNSLLQDISTGHILDLSGLGLNDLQTGLIRTTTEPGIIFREDPLRLLRAVRFATQLSFSLEAKTLAAIRKQAEELRYISQERRAEETLKILNLPNFNVGLCHLKNTELLPYVFPGLKISRPLLAYLNLQVDTNNNKKINKLTLSSLSLRERLVLVLWKAKDPQIYLKSLKLAKAERLAIGSLMDLCKSMRQKQRRGSLVTRQQILLAADQIGEQDLEFQRIYPLTGSLYSPHASDFETDLQLSHKLSLAVTELKSRIFPLTGDDLMANFNVKSGIIIKRLLSEARRYWLKHPGTDQAEMLSHLKTYLTKNRSKL